MIKLFEMFAGYGGASFALKKAGVPFECVGYSEIDKFAVQCFEQNHDGKNFGDCTKIDPNNIPDFDLLTGGFPCQSFSVAGKGLGEQDTRGTLFHEIIRIAEVKKPKYMLLENVKGLVSKKHKATFEKILSELDRIGYDVKWNVLNSKNYSIPQNRERIFFVCKLRTKYGLNWQFSFPDKEELKIFLKDILENKVEKKYFLSNKRKNLIFNGKRFGSTGQITSLNGVSQCLSASMGMGGGYEPKIIHNCLTEALGRSGSSSEFKSSCKKVYESSMQIRKLTPKECFRLMGFLNDEINLKGLSNTQRYKLAGNGWDINIVSKIFKEMFKNENSNSK